MSIELIMQEELKGIHCPKNTIIFLNTTAKSNKKFSVLPRRSTSKFNAYGFFIGDSVVGDVVCKYIDGKAKYILVDTENKQNFNLFSIAKKNISKSQVIPFKPNDVTVESCDLLVRHLFEEDIQGKKVLIFGSGNLASKMALRLAERQAEVFVWARNQEKASTIVDALNYILPKYNDTKIKLFHRDENDFDLMISFLSAENVIGTDFFNYLKKEGTVIDGGINNFSKDFIEVALNNGVSFIRLDTRIAFHYALMSLNLETFHFFDNVFGTREIEQIRCVAGGILGKQGDVIVDQIKHPTQVIGVANGLGGVKHECELTDEERRKSSTIREYILQSNKKNV
jgi:Shikimate / quinate 5-dehydrogenase